MIAETAVFFDDGPDRLKVVVSHACKRYPQVSVAAFNNAVEINASLAEHFRLF